ncbi:acyl carrier protein [Marinicrinis sediminis]|uniref:Acyl carrier protein n=1 Tax=Marinicrinis sediminis TaxID=1652465 RepID=A0ABW5R6T3_9BACL
MTALHRIVLAAVEECNEHLEPSIQVDEHGNGFLYGREGVLDSVGLVSLLVMVEQQIEEELNISLDLTSGEQNLNQKNSPFATIHQFVDYLQHLMAESSVQTH